MAVLALNVTSVKFIHRIFRSKNDKVFQIVLIIKPTILFHFHLLKLQISSPGLTLS